MSNSISNKTVLHEQFFEETGVTLRVYKTERGKPSKLPTYPREQETKFGTIVLSRDMEYVQCADVWMLDDNHDQYMTRFQEHMELAKSSDRFNDSAAWQQSSPKQKACVEAFKLVKIREGDEADDEAAGQKLLRQNNLIALPIYFNHNENELSTKHPDSAPWVWLGYQRAKRQSYDDYEGGELRDEDRIERLSCEAERNEIEYIEGFRAIGVIFVDKDEAKLRLKDGFLLNDKEVVEHTKEILRSEIARLDHYLGGREYHYVVTGPDGDVLAETPEFSRFWGENGYSDCVAMGEALAAQHDAALAPPASSGFACGK